MVAIRYFGVLLLATAARVAGEQTEPKDAGGSAVIHDQSTRGLHSNTGHIIFQSMTATPEPSMDSHESEELADLPSDESMWASSASADTPALGHSHMRDDPAECLAAGVENWDQGLQIGGVFIILALSLAGAMLPVVCKHTKWLQASTRVFTVGKFFGAGVILATAFVHMLGAAIETLGDPCLDGRMGDFDSWPAFLAMLAILAMHLMEHVLARRADRMCRVATANDSIESSGDSAQQLKPDDSNGEHTPRLDGSTPMHAADLSRLEKDEHAGHVHAALFTDDDSDEQRKRLSTYILELGIALHSIIVGMTLAVAGGTEFKTLLAAISFHQFFEGMALGTRISALRFRRRPLLVCLLNASIFALTTPLGQVLGIGIRQTFAPRSPSALLAMGVLDALSAGILMYSAIVNLLVEEFAAREFRQASRKLRIACFAAMYAGCAAMSIIGRWA
ncbi:hypothetical protein H4S01_005915 [Coemansia sp. RSA 2610]|nr:hypothetical protein H4S01_005915 [Coemansia sp. RSA 2610]